MKKKIICFSLMITLILVGTMGSFFNSYAYKADESADINKDSHYRILKRSMKLLESDNPKMYHIAKDYLSTMQEASVWQDGTIFRSENHYYNPTTGLGMASIIGHCVSSKVRTEEYFNKAIKEYKNGNKNDAFWNLGMAIHLVQDIHIPHHTRDGFWAGEDDYHGVYEKYVRDNSELRNSIDTATNETFRNLVQKKDSTAPMVDVSQILYGSTNSGNWIHYIALTSTNYYDTMVVPKPTTKMKTAGKFLIPLTIGTTEGFIQYFFNTLINDGVNVGYYKTVVNKPGHYKTVPAYTIVGNTGPPNYQPIYSTTTTKVWVNTTYKDVWVKVPYYDYSKYNL